MTSIKRKNMIQQNFINSLPHNLIIDILARVAAHSFKDFINVKLCCREWNELGEDGYVLKHLSLPEFKECQVKEEESEEYKLKSSWLLNKCADADNVEALYRKGLVDYLRDKEPEYAVECLIKAANAGHVGAEYVVGMISILWGGEEGWERGTLCLKAIMQSKELREKAITGRQQLVYARVKTAGEYNKRVKAAGEYNKLRSMPEWRPRRRCCTKSDHIARRSHHIIPLVRECPSCSCDMDIMVVFHIMTMTRYSFTHASRLAVTLSNIGAGCFSS